MVDQALNHKVSIGIVMDDCSNSILFFFARFYFLLKFFCFVFFLYYLPWIWK